MLLEDLKQHLDNVKNRIEILHRCALYFSPSETVIRGSKALCLAHFYPQPPACLPRASRSPRPVLPSTTYNNTQSDEHRKTFPKEEAFEILTAASFNRGMQITRSEDGQSKHYNRRSTSLRVIYIPLFSSTSF